VRCRGTGRAGPRGSPAQAGCLTERRAGGSGVALHLPLGPGQIHVQPDQLLLRPVVDVALQPAQRHRLGGDGGVAALREPAELGLGSRAGGQEQPADGGPQQGHPADDERHEDGEDDADDGAEGDPGRRRVLEPEDLRQLVRVRRMRQGPIPGPVGEPGQGERPDRHVQRIQPRLRIAQRCGQLADRTSLGGDVRGAGNGPAQDSGQPGALERGEAAGGEQRRGHDGNADPHDQQPGAQAEAGDDDDESGEATGKLTRT
jgi:hypothetical protein